MDDNLTWSDWEVLVITMSKDKSNYYSLSLMLLERFPLLQQLWNIWRDSIE